MALSLTDDHLLVKFAKFVETFFGSKAHSNFCVSKAMKEDLRVKWKIKLVFLISSVYIQTYRLMIFCFV